MHIISKHESHDKNRNAIVVHRDKEFRVVMFDVYFELEKEQFFKDIQSAEDCAEDWVLYA